MPGGLKSRLRGWYYNLTTRGSPILLEIKSGANCLETTLDRRLRMKILAETRADLETQFQHAEHAAEMRAFLRSGSSPGHFLDVGANNGFFACIFCLFHSSNRAVAFEPSQLFVGRIRELLQLNDLGERISIVGKAVGSEASEQELLLDEEGGYVQSAQFPGTARGSWRRIVLQTTTLDAECSRLVFSPSLLKIDIEGYEWEALQGADGILDEFKPEIFLELHLSYLEHRGLNPREVITRLERHGYRFWSLSDKRLAPREISGSWSPVVRLIARRPS